MPARHFLLSMTCLAVLAACKPSAPPAPEPAVTATVAAAADPSWDAFVEAEIENHVQVHPAWAVVQGRHEFDGRLPDWSRAGIEAEIARLHAVRAAAMAFGDDALSEQQRYQREYLVSRLDHDLFWTEKARWPFRNPQFYFGWMSDSLDPSTYIALDYAPIEQRMAAFTTYLEAIPGAAQQIRDNLEIPMPRTWLQLGIDAFGGYASYFRDDVPAVWATVSDRALQARFASANEVAATAMHDLADWLESNRATATEDFALGPDLYREMLWDTERVDISLADLEAVGRADMARNLKALRAACDEFAAAASLQDCMGKMAARKPPEGSVEAARNQLEETRAFMVAEDLVSIPGTEKALVDEAPPYARSNSAYINIPGPWEKGQPSVYYISPPNPSWPEDVQADYIAGESDLLFTSVHEVWPGHFLNFLHANRAPWFYGRVFVGYAFGEGWAHYSEEMMLEAGLRGADAETRIGQLSNALLRNARYLSSIGLHTQGWSVEESRRFFMDEAYQAEGTALQQSSRGTYDPGYLNYTMGKLLIWQLREDWTASRGGRAAWREFHDTFLSYGGPPIPLVRQQMMGEPEPRAVFRGQQAAATVSAVRQLNWAWNCADGRYLVTSFRDDNLLLYLPGRTEQLQQARSASGARYTAADIEFWNKGDEASFTEGDASSLCTIDRRASIWEDARLRGADFRGQGNEPGWHLELFSDGQPSLLVSDYGQQQFSFDATGPTTGTDGVSRFYSGSADGVTIRVSLSPGPCQDTMADEEYMSQVRVEVGERVLTGCGNSLH
jgi:uncharacterized protein (DUF885 family)/membrane-bound inhibitor of C-type lysozyme/uncharacterized membrane protein